MEFAFELIREAGVRMPGPLGGTIGIVGGLIIGDAAVSANLVSPMTVVVVAVSALCSLAIPNEEFGAPFRLLKFGFILLAGLMSCGIPYLMPFVGKGLAGYHAPKDSVWRPPLHQMRERPVFTKRDQRVRLRKNRKAAEPEEKQERGE